MFFHSCYVKQLLLYIHEYVYILHIILYETRGAVLEETATSNQRWVYSMLNRGMEIRNEWVCVCAMNIICGSFFLFWILFEFSQTVNRCIMRNRMNEDGTFSADLWAGASVVLRCSHSITLCWRHKFIWLTSFDAFIFLSRLTNCLLHGCAIRDRVTMFELSVDLRARMCDHI